MCIEAKPSHAPIRPGSGRSNLINTSAQKADMQAALGTHDQHSCIQPDIQIPWGCPITWERLFEALLVGRMQESRDKEFNARLDFAEGSDSRIRQGRHLLCLSACYARRPVTTRPQLLCR
jgi:hypothetical protein